MPRILAVVAAVAAVVVAVAIVLSSGEEGGPSATNPPSKVRGAAPATVRWKPVSGSPLVEPTQIERPVGSGPQDINVDLTARNGQATIAGSPIWARTYNGDFVGPTIHARPGDTIKVTFRSQLGGAVKTNLHYHGLHVTPLGNGDNIFATIKDGDVYRTQVTLMRNQPRGTFWYHAHFHGISDGQVMGGLAGLIMIDGLKNLLPEYLRDVHERQITLRDVQLGKEPNPPGIDGDYLADNRDIDPVPSSTFRMVNGLYQPTFAMQSSKYELWHLANTGSDVFYKVALAKRSDPKDAQTFAILAEDGIPVWKVERERELLIPPGKRFDVLVLGRAPGTYVLQSLPYAQRANKQLVPKEIPCDQPTPDDPCTPVAQTLATVQTAGPERPVPVLPTRVAREGDPTAEDLSKLPIDKAAQHTFNFSYGTGEKFEAMINDRLFDIKAQPIVSPVLGDIQEWNLVNKTRDDHPFHIHINGFQVISVNGEKYQAHGHQDVVNIPKQTKNAAGETVDGRVVIRHKFEDFDGWFVFHCHILNHEDSGMMTTIQVRKNSAVAITPPPEAKDPDAGHHAG